MNRTPKRWCRSGQRRTQLPAGRKQLYEWYSNWKILQFTCEHCGWTGKGEEAFPDEVGMMECPRCDHGVGYVQFASLRDTERAAVEGNADAIRDLPEKREWVKRMEARMSRFHREKLCSLDQLPELEGESLEFTWDLADHVADEDYQIIRLGDREVWRELKFIDNILRFNEIKDLLKRKYGARFKSLTPTGRSLDLLTGEHFYKLETLSWA